LTDNDDAPLLQDESSARLKLLQLDVTSEVQVNLVNTADNMTTLREK
jgi:hypothetical protein